MLLSVATDFYRFGATLDRLERQELPFAAALALNTTARGAAGALTRELPAIFAKKGAPTPFTLRAIGTTGARKSNLAAAIFVKRDQAKYLGIEETGGTRISRPGAPVLTPVDILRNAYGNIPRGMLRRLLEDPESYFLGTIRGVYGLWERTSTPGQKILALPRGLRLLAAFRRSAHYRPRFGFHDRIGAYAAANFRPALEAGLARAIATSVRH